MKHNNKMSSNIISVSDPKISVKTAVNTISCKKTNTSKFKPTVTCSPRGCPYVSKIIIA